MKAREFIKAWTWDVSEVNANYMMNDTNNIFIGASDVGDYVTSQIVLARTNDNKETDHVEFTILATLSQWGEVINKCGLKVVQLRRSNGLMIDTVNDCYVQYDINSSSIEVKVYGDTEFVEHWYDKLTEEFEEVKNVIEWIYSGDGQSIEIPVRSDRVPIDEMYPFLNGESLSSYYDRFMQSSASILLLIGPPGTGKTTFIRGLLQHAETSAMVTYDTNILSKDYIFANFVEGDRNVFIVEDADNFLSARSDGNDFMHKFLNVGDGLVTTKNKKMIFSTNLPSIRDIDPALIRPGRCFDILHFDALNDKQADVLAKKLGVEYEKNDSGKYSIAELFHKQVEAPRAPKRKLGFV